MVMNDTFYIRDYDNDDGISHPIVGEWVYCLVTGTYFEIKQSQFTHLTVELIS